MAAWSRRRFTAASALAGMFSLAPLSGTGAGKTTSAPWRNWSGGLACQPAGRFSPATVGQLQEFMAAASGTLRPVGAGHSFAALVPTDGHLLVLDQLSGLLGHDAHSLQATFGAGSRLGDMGAPLENIGQAMLNLPDIDRQTLAGATATATHGTGIDFTCLSGYVTALDLVTPAGELMSLNATQNADLFNAARVSLGALGVVTAMTLQNRTPYRLRAKNWVQPIEEVLEGFDESAAAHRHFEMFPLTHSDYALTLAIDETDAAINNPPSSPEEDAAFAQAMAQWATLPPRARKPHVDGLAAQIEATEVVDTSYKILSNIRNNRFNEMEYSVPVEAGADCLREILKTVIDREVDVVFPLEYRYVRRDNTWLSMSSGDEDHAAISIHRTAAADYRPYFQLIEPIFWKYGGRPHWGKVHSLGAQQLQKIYPRFADFQALRAAIDPQNKMLNEHLHKLFVGSGADA